ncbi:unnamed protein product [Phyllotreta striolata]|uniref:Cytochrome P450 n=1 Tax=Phyllotreta striolata TaxID=444603 RepID=A0A9N9XHY8_PHYSR|nr:unnamed protein product [Phyllotreta striolata]
MLIVLIVTAIGTFIWFLHYRMNFWRRSGVPQPSFRFNFMEIIHLFAQKRSTAETIELMYSMFPGKRYCGLYSFSYPMLMIRDPDLLKELTVKSFDHFTDHPSFISEEAEPLWGKNLFSLKGKRWRDMRPILSPSFTSSKMRGIFVLISECAKNFTDYYRKFDGRIVDVELKDSFTRFTNDVIAAAAFGVKSDSLAHKDNQFYLMGKELTMFSASISATLKMVLFFVSPKLFNLLKLRLFKKEVMDFFIRTIEDTVEMRKKEGIVRPDMIHLMIEAQKGSSGGNKEAEVEDRSFSAQTEADLGGAPDVQRGLTNVDIAAQALIFFFGGFESVSSLMCFMGHELAVNQDIQERLREEILETLEANDGELTYDALVKMNYMDMVVSEALRKWPTVTVTDRECSKPYTIEPKLPGEKPVHVNLKDTLWIPVFGIHRDPLVYPDPEKFDPERFNSDNKGDINPYNYIPFGAGPRNCIASRFALLEIKTVFFYILLDFKLVPTAKSRIPVKLSPNTFNLTAEGGFWFGLEKIN